MKMTSIDWQRLRWFKADEKTAAGLPAFPSPLKMELELLMLLDEMRSVAGVPFVIHSSYELTGHAAESQHGDGSAIDGHFLAMGVIEQYLFAEQFNPPGLGFYPFWNRPGIHLDVRPLAPYKKAARWWRDQQGKYQKITVAALKKFIWKEGDLAGS